MDLNRSDWTGGHVAKTIGSVETLGSLKNVLSVVTKQDLCLIYWITFLYLLYCKCVLFIN